MIIIFFNVIFDCVTYVLQIDPGIAMINVSAIEYTTDIICLIIWLFVRCIDLLKQYVIV